MISLDTPVSVAVVGDVLTVDGKFHAVRDRCDEDRVSFYCLPCKQLLANLLQLSFHLEDGNPHCIARSCPYHGLEAP